MGPEPSRLGKSDPCPCSTGNKSNSGPYRGQGSSANPPGHMSVAGVFRFACDVGRRRISAVPCILWGPWRQTLLEKLHPNIPARRTGNALQAMYRRPARWDLGALTNLRWGKRDVS